MKTKKNQKQTTNNNLKLSAYIKDLALNEPKQYKNLVDDFAKKCEGRA